MYARVTEVKHWIQFIAQGAMDTSCNHKIPHRPGTRLELILWLVLVLNLLLFSGLLLTGGTNNDDEASYIAEVILPSGWTCRLPRLPHPGRHDHSQSSLTACGGYDSSRALLKALDS